MPILSRCLPGLVAAAWLLVPATRGADAPAAWVRVSGGTVHLVSPTGRRIPVHRMLALRPGDVLTTSPSTSGSIRSGKTEVPLEGLARYRVTGTGLEFARPGERFRPVSVADPSGPVPAAGLAAWGTLVEVAGDVARRGAGWPRAERLEGPAVLFVGDELRLGEGARAVVTPASPAPTPGARTSGKDLVKLLGAGRFRMAAGALVLQGGEALVRGVLAVDLPHLGARVLGGSVRVVRGLPASPTGGDPWRARIAVLSGVGAVVDLDFAVGALSRGTDASLGSPAGPAPRRWGGDWPGPPPSALRLVPGQEVVLEEGRTPRIESVAVARLLSAFEEAPGAGARSPASPHRDRPPDPGGEAAGRTGGAGRRGGADEEPEIHVRPRFIEGRVEMPLRDRIEALDGPANRLFYFRKLELLEARGLLAATPSPRSEPEGLARHRRARARARAGRALAELARAKEEAFERGLLVPDARRDRTLAREREWTYAMPPWLLTRNLVGPVRAAVASRRADAAVLSARIQAARASGAPSSEVAALERIRQRTLDGAQAESDRLAALVRLADEPGP